MNYSLTGTIYKIEETKTHKGDFKSREFIVEVTNETNSDWNDFVKLQVTQDKCNILDGYKIKERIDVQFNLKGRRYKKEGEQEEKFFSSLEAWKITKLEEKKAEIKESDKKDDLPF